MAAVNYPPFNRSYLINFLNGYVSALNTPFDKTRLKYEFSSTGSGGNSGSALGGFGHVPIRVGRVRRAIPAQGL